MKVTVKAEELQRGDVIPDMGRRITVSIVDRQPPRCRGYVHVNETLCWNRGDLITVERPE